MLKHATIPANCFHLTTVNGMVFRYNAINGFSKTGKIEATGLVIEYVSSKEFELLQKGDENPLVKTETLLNLGWSDENYELVPGTASTLQCINGSFENPNLKEG